MWNRDLNVGLADGSSARVRGPDDVGTGIVLLFNNNNILIKNNTFKTYLFLKKVLVGPNKSLKVKVRLSQID